MICIKAKGTTLLEGNNEHRAGSEPPGSHDLVKMTDDGTNIDVNVTHTNTHMLTYTNKEKTHAHTPTQTDD